MANSFQNVEGLARDASIMLRDNLVAANLINRDVQQDYTDSTGGLVSVSYVPKGSATTQDNSSAPSSLSISDITESKVQVDARHYVYHKRRLNTKEKTYQAGEFSEKVVMPSMIALAEAVDQRIIDRLAIGFAGQSGTAGTVVNGAADIVAARKVLKDQGVSMNGLVGIVGTQAEANLLGFAEFVNEDYGDNIGSAITRAQLARRYDIDWFSSQNAGGTHAETSDVDGTVLANDAGIAIGDTTLVTDGYTASSGTVPAGTKLTIGGDMHTVTADATIATNAATLSIEPAIKTAHADDAPVTFFGDYTKDLIFQPATTAGAIIAPAPLMHNSAVVPFEGLSVRVTTESTTADSTFGAVDTVLFDVYVGAQVIRGEGGVILQG